MCPLSVGVADGGPRNRHENGGAFREMNTQPASLNFHGAFAHLGHECFKLVGHLVSPACDLHPIAVVIRKQVDVRADAMLPTRRENRTTAEDAAVRPEPCQQQRCHPGEHFPGVSPNDDLGTFHGGNFVGEPRPSCAARSALSSSRRARTSSRTSSPKTNSASWRASIFRLTEKSATISAIPSVQDSIHVVVQDPKAFFGGL